MSATQTSHQTAKPLDISQIYEMVRANAFPSLWLWGLVAVLCLVDVAAICINPRLFFDFKPIITTFDRQRKIVKSDVAEQF